MQKTHLRSLRNLQRPPQGPQWYRIENRVEGASKLYLYDDIGMFGITATAFLDDLARVTGDLDIHVNSCGGEVFDGLAIYNALKNRAGKTTVYVDSLAASIASVIAMAGDQILIADSAMFMIHDAQGAAMGSAADMEYMRDLLDKNSANIAKVYASRSGRDADEFRQMMLAETWFDAQEAVAAGLADGILGGASGEGEPVSRAAQPTASVTEPILATAPPAPTAGAVDGVRPVDGTTGVDTSSVVMPTPSPFASWDLKSIREAITAAKEATTHG